MIKRWPYHVMATRRHQAKPRTKRLNDKLRGRHLAAGSQCHPSPTRRGHARLDWGHVHAPAYRVGSWHGARQAGLSGGVVFRVGRPGAQRVQVAQQ
jgi:hypothetical protein